MNLADDQEKEKERLSRERDEALEQLSAASEVLKVISSSRSELAPVFQAILENATRICEANFGTLYLAEGEYYRAAAMHNAPIEFVEFQRQRGLFHPTPGAMLDRTTRMKKVSYSADAASEAVIGNSARIGGARSVIYVPMLKDDVSVGALVIYRREVQPFTEKQIELLANFASQAVIAIENTRLLNELHKRTSELEQSYGLVQQQASQLEGQSQELVKLNQHLEQRVNEQVGEIERMGRLRRFLPPQVADLIVSSGSEKQLESHRREITALFCDLRGFTGFSESSDPEDVMALLREYHAAIGKIIVKYSGTLDALRPNFGSPEGRFFRLPHDGGLAAPT
jgi:adenylate cyclase